MNHEEITIRTHKLKHNDWCYMKLQIFPDPSIHQDESKLLEYANVAIDMITWKSIILLSLNKLYGLIGEASPFDLLAVIDPKTILIRMHKQDFPKFNNSLMSWTFNLNQYYPVDVACYVKVISLGEFVGLCA
ncbi:hypothetical protein Cantr_09756 [Candida viswanathii]|uniref:Ribonucleases P/MRP subunit Pop8-like domain-containing protein n=1 Tax=Candida viswanathii TaxID=5486 RepID=A0A367YC93_9ASCO|nr:hypothetical protein Cantr_09756 [Candida viswanathii]